MLSMFRTTINFWSVKLYANRTCKHCSAHNWPHLQGGGTSESAHARNLGAQTSSPHFEAKFSRWVLLPTVLPSVLYDLLLSKMTPPLPWYLSLEDGKIRFYKNGQLMRQEKGPDSGKEYGCVTSVEVAKIRDKELLRVSSEYLGFTNRR